ATANPIRLDEIAVRKGRLRIFVDHPLIAVRRRVVDVEVVLLHVLAVVALTIRQAEIALLEDRVVLVPQSEREAQPLAVVAQARDAVLAPPIGPRSSLVVGEVGPRIAVVAVVLAYRAPLAVAPVGAPATPVASLAGLPQAALLGRRGEGRVGGPSFSRHGRVLAAAAGGRRRSCVGADDRASQGGYPPTESATLHPPFR